MIDRDGLAALLTWIQAAGMWGAVIVALAYIPASILFIPASVLTLGAGFIFGVGRGLAVVSIGSTAGASAAFLIARTFGHDWVARRIASRPAIGAVIGAVERDAAKIVLLTRLSPLFPFNVLNYAFGLSRVPFKTFVLASWIGMLPGGLMYTYLGSAAHSLAAAISGGDRRTTGQQAMFAVGLIATVVATTMVTRSARRALGTVVTPR